MKIFKKGLLLAKATPKAYPKATQSSATPCQCNKTKREAINFSFFAKCYGYVDLYKSSFILPFILSKIDLVQDNSSIKQIFSGILIISVVGLFCFINIVYYMTGYILITRGNYEEKYPRLKRIIQYYKTTNLIFIFIEVILCFTCLLLITIFSLLFVIK